MKFRRLKLTGFKSFVEPADLRIEPGLTGVVGPNGCGKSNLLEALRWVMGEGSPKSLRGGGMEDVIFAGTTQRPQRDFAEVSLLLEAEGQEREVTRRIERGAGSAYRIDGRDVRQRDVALLFADAATGAHSPALVSQGRISAVIAARPAERRQMLEEAAGIAGLHVRRKDAEQKLRATEANLQRLDELLGDQEARAAALRRQARAAERYRSLSERIRQHEARLLYARWVEADRAASAAGTQADAARREVEALGRKLHEAEAAQQAAAALVAERRQAAIRSREEGQELAHRLAASRAALDTARRRLADISRQSVQIEAERQREAALQDDAAAATTSLEAEQLAIAARLEQAETGQQDKTRALGLAEERHREAEADLAALLTREATLAAERHVAEAALTAAQGQEVRLTVEVSRVESQLTSLGAAAEFVSRCHEARSAVAARRLAIASLEAALETVEDVRRSALLEREGAEATLAAARAAHASVQGEIRALDEALATGPGRGVIARLKVAPGFERALAAALGEDLAAPIDPDQGWTGAAVAAGDPSFGPGVTCLADHVEAPPELARRLALVAILEVDDGRLLAAGQRLVTLDGRLRRWDGFVGIGEGAAAAQRLERANRLAELRGSLPALTSDMEQAGRELEAASECLTRAGIEVECTRAGLRAAEVALRDAERAEGSSSAALERHEEQGASLRRRLAEMAPLQQAAAEALKEAAERVGAAPETGLLAAEIAEARSKVARTGGDVADLRADIATAARILTADRERQIVAAREAAAWGERSNAARLRLADTDERASALLSEQEALQGEPERLATITRTLEQRIQSSSAIFGATLAAERDAEAALGELGRALARANEALAVARETRAAAAARADAEVARRIEHGRLCGEKFQCPPPLLTERFGFAKEGAGDPVTEEAALERLTNERERLGPVNLVAEQELAEVEHGRARAIAEREELGQAIHRLRGSIGSLNREGRLRLLDAYAAVDRHFRSLFATLFDGGQAHLALIDSDDPLEAGLEIMAQPPGKRLSALSLLSGGEQALTAVALIFALFLTKPSPICVLDEVDAPLDDANVERFCDLLVRMTAETDTRYLIVTHNAVTMSRMHRLYGVTMVERGVSRIVSVDLGGAEQLLAAE